MCSVTDSAGKQPCQLKISIRTDNFSNAITYKIRFFPRVRVSTKIISDNFYLSTTKREGIKESTQFNMPFTRYIAEISLSRHQTVLTICSLDNHQLSWLRCCMLQNTRPDVYQHRRIQTTSTKPTSFNAAWSLRSRESARRWMRETAASKLLRRMRSSSVRQESTLILSCSWWATSMRRINSCWKSFSAQHINIISHTSFILEMTNNNDTHTYQLSGNGVVHVN